MGKKGLKVRISFTIFGILAIGMLLVNLVVTAFWQRDLIASQINTEKSNLRIWGELLQRLQPTASPTYLQEIQRLAGKRIHNIARYDGQLLVYAGESKKEKLGELVVMAASARGDLVQASGTEWGFLSPEDSYASIAVYLSPGKAVGSVVRLQSVYQKIGENQQIILIYILVNSIILTSIGLFRLVNLVLRPIDRLVNLTETYSASETDFFFPIKTENEFGTLALALNTLLKRIEEDREKLRTLITSLEKTNQQLHTTQKEKIVAEKMAAVGLLSAGIAHEIGNPLSIIQGYIELLADRGLADEEAMQFSERALHELDRVSVLIQQLLNYARATSKDTVPASLTTLLSETIEAVQFQKHCGIIIFDTEFHLDREILVGDSSGLRQVTLNCLLNAVDAINDNDEQQSGRIVVTCSHVSRKNDAEGVLITISDNGSGMTETELLSAFDPFYTTKRQGHGTGLGLFVSYAIVEAMKGKMWLESTPGKGTDVHIELAALD